MTYIPTYTLADLGHTAIMTDGDVVEQVSYSHNGRVKQKDKNHYVWMSDLQTAFDMFKRYYDRAEKCIAEANENGFTEAADLLNRTLLTCDRERVKFTGASTEETLQRGDGDMDMSQHQTAKQKISAISSIVEEYLSKSRPGRRRTFSAEDGDFIIDRTFDIKPFAATLRHLALAIPKLTIVCNVSFSAGVQSDFINKHCALAWSIVDMFESVGVMCSVYVTWYARNVCEKAKLSQFIFELKKHDSYVAPLNIARGMACGFYRMVGFLTMVDFASTLEQDSHYGLGQPDNSKNDLPFFKDGVLFITEETTQSLNKMTQPEQAAKWLLDKMMPGLIEMGLAKSEQ